MRLRCTKHRTKGIIRPEEIKVRMWEDQGQSGLFLTLFFSLIP